MPAAPAAARKARPVSLALLLALALGGCGTRSTVVRVVDGREVRGREISPEAYAATLEGALAEASGDRSGALAAYERAVEEDSSNAEAWARLGFLRCTTDRARANEALARATEVDPASSGAWLARARCELLRGDVRAAERSALRAIEGAPGDEEANQAYSEALRRSGKREDARRWLLALSLFAPAGPPREPAPADGTLQRALDANDEDGVREAATARHVSPHELALMALARGKLTFARATADKVLAAEPQNADAFVAALAAADLLGDEARLGELLRRPPETRTPLGAGATRLLEELLSRRAPAGR